MHQHKTNLFIVPVFTTARVVLLQQCAGVITCSYLVDRRHNNWCCVSPPFACLLQDVAYDVFLTVQMWLFKDHLGRGPHQLVRSVNTVQEGQVHSLWHYPFPLSCWNNSHAGLWNMGTDAERPFQHNTAWRILLSYWSFEIWVMRGTFGRVQVHHFGELPSRLSFRP